MSVNNTQVHIHMLALHQNRSKAVLPIKNADEEPIDSFSTAAVDNPQLLAQTKLPDPPCCLSKAANVLADAPDQLVYLSFIAKRTHRDACKDVSLPSFNMHPTVSITMSGTHPSRAEGNSTRIHQCCVCASWEFNGFGGWRSRGHHSATHLDINDVLSRCTCISTSYASPLHITHKHCS